MSIKLLYTSKKRGELSITIIVRVHINRKCTVGFFVIYPY